MQQYGVPYQGYPYYGMGNQQMIQPQLNDLYRQRDLVDQRINQFQQYPQNQNAQVQNVFETRWVKDEDDAKHYVNAVTSQPLLLFTQGSEVFYMVNNGTLQKFSYVRIDEESQIKSLEQKMNELTENMNLVLSYIDQGGATNGKLVSNVAESSTTDTNIPTK